MKYNPDIHHRHSMRLKEYDYSSRGMYFVTIYTQDRAMLFRHVGAALCGRPDHAEKMVIKWLMETENRFAGTKIDKFVLMPNHIHFIVFMPGGHMDQGGHVGQGGHIGPPLHEIVGWFKTMTTGEYIRGVKSGLYPPFNRRIWQRSYHDHIIRNEDEYKRIWQYIDENPAKWAEDEYCT